MKYEVLVFVKHDAWNEFGEGGCVPIAVHIGQDRVEGAQYQADPDFNEPAEWTPTVSEPVTISLPLEHDEFKAQSQNYSSSIVVGQPTPFEEQKQM